MHRLFSMFPQGGPGVALLLLRISVGAIFYVNVTQLARASSPYLLLAGAALVVLSLCAGFLTPYLAFIAGVAALATVLTVPGSGLIHVVPMVDAAVLALLGPGAYSVDARLFGRRVTVVPPRPEKRPG